MGIYKYMIDTSGTPEKVIESPNNPDFWVELSKDKSYYSLCTDINSDELYFNIIFPDDNGGMFHKFSRHENKVPVGWGLGIDIEWEEYEDTDVLNVEVKIIENKEIQLIAKLGLDSIQINKNFRKFMYNTHENDWLVYWPTIDQHKNQIGKYGHGWSGYYGWDKVLTDGRLPFNVDSPLVGSTYAIVTTYYYNQRKNFSRVLYTDRQDWWNLEFKEEHLEDDYASGINSFIELYDVPRQEAKDETIPAEELCVIDKLLWVLCKNPGLTPLYKTYSPTRKPGYYWVLEGTREDMFWVNDPSYEPLLLAEFNEAKEAGRVFVEAYEKDEKSLVDIRTCCV